MRRFHPFLVIPIIGILLIATVVMLTNLKEPTAVLTGSVRSEPVATPNIVYLPRISNSDPNHSISQTEAISTVSGISLPSDWSDTDPQHLETPEPIPNEVIHAPVLYTPAPTPDLNKLVTTELDSIAFSNPRLLSIPLEKHPTFGLVVWSPDSKQFIGTLLGDTMVQFGDQGRIVTDLYLGDTESGEINLWQVNGGWPYWSKDGQSIYYLSVRSGNDGIYYDLYQRTLHSQTEEARLLAQDLTAPKLAQPVIAELADHSLLTLNLTNQPTLLQARSQQTKGSEAGVVNEFVLQQYDLSSMIPEINSLQTKDYNLSFSASPDNTSLVLISASQSMLLLDSSTLTVLNRIKDTAYFYSNLSWASDNQRFAYATGDSAYIYDLQTKDVIQLLTKADLGLRIDDRGSGISMPVWSPDHQVVLVSVFSPDWLPSDGTGEPHFKNYIFAITRDGKNRKPISTYSLNSISPDGSHAIVEQWNSAQQQYEKFFVDITWN